jgi:small conductance mechanosensitive channel
VSNNRSASSSNILPRGASRTAGSLLFFAVLLQLMATIPPASADEVALVEAADKAIPLDSDARTDQQIENRIRDILMQIEALHGVEVDVSQGVVKLSGEVPNEAGARQALAIVGRVEGVIAVQDSVTRTLNLQDNINPAVRTVRDTLRGWIRALPLLLAASALFALVVFAAHRLARRRSLWSRLTPNPFLADLAAQAVRIAGIVLGLLLALNLLGATALMGTILGSAGVIGLAISFGVKDSLENYICSIMLSIRQPFRAEDFVAINEYEGVVVRLTSRSTVLMTLDGNHLRIPNAIVYKSPILNYTRNPQRRFDFVLGIDAEDDPADAISVGLAAIAGLEWILEDPAPHAVIDSVGDSNILVCFRAWIDQRNSDFGKARSLSIRAAKNALEAAGFTLPEPIYRLRFDQEQIATTALALVERAPAEQDTVPQPQKPDNTTRARLAAADEEQDVQPETHVSEQVREERILAGERDLLDESRPVE